MGSVRVQTQTATADIATKAGRRLPALGVLAAIVLAAVISSTLTAIADHTNSTVSTGPAPAMEDRFLELLNASRNREGLSSLRRADGADNVAREWAHVMAVDNELKHRPSLRTPFDGAWQKLGENVGVGFSADSLHQAFLDSPGHRANIMGDYQYVGIGVALAGSRTWVAFNFVKGDPGTRSSYDANPLWGGYATGAGSGGSYNDLSSTVHARDIRTLDQAGAAVSCATSRYCPAEPLRRSEMAALLVRALDLPAAGEQFGDVASSHPYAAEIGALARAGITKGCNPPANDRFCPEDPVTREQMASFFVRALDLPRRSTTPFGDVSSSGSVHWQDVAALASSGITKGCNPPSNSKYCPRQDVTRGQMASFIVRGLDL